MALRTINEVYELRRECMDIPAVLLSSTSTEIGNSDQFPMKIEGKLPFLETDPQLLRHIQINVVNNGIKYGTSCEPARTLRS